MKVWKHSLQKYLSQNFLSKLDFYAAQSRNYSRQMTMWLRSLVTVALRDEVLLKKIPNLECDPAFIMKLMVKPVATMFFKPESVIAELILNRWEILRKCSPTIVS